MSEGADIMDVELAVAEDLPPHRAAIPVPPLPPGSEHHLRRRDLVRMAVVFSLALHVGFFLAALIWGQGRPLPDGGAALVRVHLAQAAHHETVIEKAGASEARPPDASQIQADASPAPQSEPPTQQAPIEVQQPGPVALTAHLEARPAPAAERMEQSPTPPDREAVQAEGAPVADPHATRAKLSALADEPDSLSRSAARLGIPTSPETAKPPLPAYKPSAPRKKNGESSTSAVTGDDAVPLPASAASRSGSLFSYKRRVRAQVMRNLPEGRWGPGRVIVGFRISRSGELLGASVARSSGNAAMDQAALACVRAAGPFPAPPRGGAPGDIALSMDFRFQ